MTGPDNRAPLRAIGCAGVAGAMLTASMCSAALSGDDESWPQFRGPNHNFVISATNWAVPGEPTVVWKKQLGIGYSTVAIKNGRLVTMGYDKDSGLDVIVCLDAKTGEKHWEYRYPAAIMARAHRGGTLVTPTLTDDAVYCSNREGWLYCFNPTSGDIKWKTQLRNQYGLKLPRWGFAGSPLIVGDQMFMNVGKVIAFDRHTGREIWQTEKNYGDAYAVPIEFDHKGERALAVFAGTGLAVLDEESGKEIMFHGWTNRAQVNAAAPVILDGGKRAFISSGYNRGCALLDLTGETPVVVWENKNMSNHMSGSILHDGYLYGFNNAQYSCLNLAGEVQWTERGIGKGAHMMAGDRLLLLSGKGEIIVLKANPEKFEVEQRVKVLDGGVYWTNPVLVNGYLYCRNSLGDLVCLDVRTGT